MDATRKIPQEQLLLIDEFQLDLRKRGISLNQKELLVESIEFTLQNRDKFIRHLTKHDNTKEKTMKLLEKSKKKYDFEKDWMEEIDTTL